MKQNFEMGDTEYNVTVRHITNKSIIEEIVNNINDLFILTSVRWNNQTERRIIVQDLEDILEEYKIIKKITTPKVVLTKNSNNYMLNISFKVFNCLNFTTIKYNILGK